MKKSVTIFTGLLTCLALLSFIYTKDKTFRTSHCFKQKFAKVPCGNVAIDGKTASVEGFYISKTEIPNYEYNRFVQAIERSGNNELLSKIQVDAAQWEKVANNKPLVKSYVNSPLYSQYPAVNMTYEGAVEYCKWLTENANKDPKSDLLYEYRLPTRAEWQRAAEGKWHCITYAWGGPKATNEKGCALCQCNRSTDPKVLYDMNTYTSPTDAYAPNSIGLYNMNGNVAEMVSEKGIAVGGSWASKDTEVTNESFMRYQTPSPLIGFRPAVVITRKS